MGRFKKWSAILLITIFATASFESCSNHYRFKKVVRKRRTGMIKRSGHHYSRFKKVKRNTIPINKNYIIKNKRVRRGWY